ncbi:MAG: CpaF/VirB11 family protein [Alphaproteobacteria bacterium]|jgi:type IV secretory pathway ATPase VirB11/archaellum biosynthesis ATPase|nr:CpaF/VirB11 family protein [Alphaproteobacteria bacterium]
MSNELQVIKNFLGEELYSYIYLEKDIEEVSINKHNEAILKHKNGEDIYRSIALTKKDWEIIFHYLGNLKKTGYRENETLVYDLPKGYRFKGSLGNITKENIAVSIRLQNEEEIFLENFKISAFVEKFLKTRVLAKNNIFISGATASGKTTFINCLIKEIPLVERIITVEEVYELKVPHKNKLEYLCANGDYDQILDDVLKSRPDRFFLGELSTQNVYAVEKFLTNGHKGFMMTMHSDNTQMAITDTFFAKFPSDKKLTTSFEKEAKLLKNTVDLVIQLEQVEINNKKQRTLTEIYLPKEDKLFKFPNEEQDFKAYIINQKLNTKNISNNFEVRKKLKGKDLKEYVYSFKKLKAIEIYKKALSDGYLVGRRRIEQLKRELKDR